MRLVLLGPPGAGKGTQGQLLAERLGIPKISSGDMLRDAAQAGTDLGRLAKQYTDRGQLVPDDVIINVVLERLERPDTVGGFLLDGFPRTVGQADRLAGWLEEHRLSLNGVLYLVVDSEEIVKRISGRRVCPACQLSYRLHIQKTRVEETCDFCGFRLKQRDDDKPECVRERLRVYHQRTEPVAAYYRERGMLVEIDGDRPIAEVTNSMLDAVQRIGALTA